MSHPAVKVYLAQRALQRWIRKQEHDKCWYYPEIFLELCDILGVDATQHPTMPRTEFELGCLRFTDELYSISPKE